jgi:hypothetical protein
MDTTEERQVDSQAEGTPDTMADAQRLFKWKDGQREKGMVVLRSIESGDDEAAQLAALLTFFETLVFSKVYHEPFECLTVHFLAFPGADEDIDRLGMGNDYSYRVFASEALLPADQRTAQGSDGFEAFLKQRK